MGTHFGSVQNAVIICRMPLCCTIFVIVFVCVAKRRQSKMEEVDRERENEVFPVSIPSNCELKMLELETLGAKFYNIQTQNALKSIFIHSRKIQLKLDINRKI